MRSRAPLALMEQLVMALVFALAAAICLQVFVRADQLSRRNALRDEAVLAVQNTAEQLKRAHGAYRPEETDGDWTLTVTPVESGQPLLGAAEVSVSDDEGELFCLRVEWQEAAHE